MVKGRDVGLTTTELGVGLGIENELEDRGNVYIEDVNGKRYMVTRKGEVSTYGKFHGVVVNILVILVLSSITGAGVGFLGWLSGLGFVDIMIGAGALSGLIWAPLVRITEPNTVKTDKNLTGITRIKLGNTSKEVIAGESLKVGLDFYKEVILLEDNSLKFVYELVDLKNSRPNDFEYKGIDEGLTLEQVRESKDNVKYRAMQLYIKNERLEDEKITQLIETYNTILQYEEDKKVYEQYQEFLDKKGEDFLIKKLEVSKQGVIKDLEELRILGKTNIEENQKIIASIK